MVWLKICSMVLHRMHIRDTGLLFAGLVLSPFLNTAVTLTCCQPVVLIRCCIIAGI